MNNFKLNPTYKIPEICTDFRCIIECDYDEEGDFPRLENSVLNFTLSKIIESDKGLNIRYVVSDIAPVRRYVNAFRDAKSIIIKHLSDKDDGKVVTKEKYIKEFGNVEWQMVSDYDSNELLYLDIFVKCELLD